MGYVAAIVYHDHYVASEMTEKRSFPFSVVHRFYVVDGEFNVITKQVKSSDQTQTVRLMSDEQFELFISGVPKRITK